LAVVLGSVSAPVGSAALAQTTDADAVVVNFCGPIQRVGAARWRVAEHEISIAGDTAVIEHAGLTAPGMWAQVQAIWQDGGRLTARRIETAQTMNLPVSALSLRDATAATVPDQQVDQLTPFKGWLILRVTATDPEQWSILLSGAPGQPWQVQSMLVDLDTAIVDERNGSIRPGVWIEGRADTPPEAGLPWTARTVSGLSGGSVEQSGVVRTVGSSSGLQVWQIDDQAAIIDSATYLDGVPGVGRYAVVRGTILSEDTIWAAEAKIRYVLRGWLTSRNDDTSPRQWLIGVPGSAEPHDGIRGRVAVLLDNSSFVHPALDSDVLGVFVEVRARATRQGWLVEAVRLADFSVQ
jgi:hypothetical protein